MIIQALAFYLFATILVVAAALVVTARNPVHSVLWLILAFFNAAGLFLLLGAEFLAMVLVVVYVGAVAVLFLFVVMMIDVERAAMRERVAQYLPMGLLVGAILLLEIGMVIIGLRSGGGLAQTQEVPVNVAVTNTQALAQVIYTRFIFLFQASGLILLIAMIGAILLTHRERAGVRRQRIAEQVARRKEETLTVHSVPSRKGL